MNTKDSFNRLLALLLITLAICIGLFWLPDTIAGYPVKKVDLLSDIRIKDTSFSLDSLRAQLEQTDSLIPDSLEIPDSIIQAGLLDMRSIALRDSLYKVIYSSQGADSTGVRIEDYSIGHTGLRRFFAALNNSKNNLGRPVRIAFMGDSFVEGDILVSDLRDAMQKRFGGHGVGFVPVTSTTSQFRPTIDQQAEGWTTHSIIHDKKNSYIISGMFFEAKADVATLSFKTSERYSTLKKVNSLKFLYEKADDVSVQFTYNGSADTLTRVLPSSGSINQYILNDTIREGSFVFSNAKGFRALGLVLEDNAGVTVDNFSLRGNSGLIWERLDPAECASFSNVRPYDLIILEYGLNAMDESMLDYGWYRSRMITVVKHLRQCFPDSDFLLLSISDRSDQYNGEFSTMPAVLSLLHTQRQIAKQAGIPFWNMFGAMGGENSMVQFVEKGWASKDYTHLSFRGGREIAKSLMNALMLEKEFYDEVQKTVQ